MNKTLLLAALLTKLHDDLDGLTRAALMARDEAINEESRAESKWDTRGQEAAYLAEGQAKMVQDLQAAIGRWEALVLPPVTKAPSRVELGRVFLLEQSEGLLRGFMGPKAGGVEFDHDGLSYTVVTPVSPVGRAVLGKQAGDFVNLMVRKKLHPHRINAVF